jgi:hypothetical protein
MKDGNTCPMDSHEHGPHGAIIATSSNIFNFELFMWNGETSMEWITRTVKLRSYST